MRAQFQNAARRTPRAYTVCVSKTTDRPDGRHGPESAAGSSDSAVVLSYQNIYIVPGGQRPHQNMSLARLCEIVMHIRTTPHADKHTRSQTPRGQVRYVTSKARDMARGYQYLDVLKFPEQCSPRPGSHKRGHSPTTPVDNTQHTQAHRQAHRHRAAAAATAATADAVADAAAATAARTSHLEV